MAMATGAMAAGGAATMADTGGMAMATGAEREVERSPALNLEINGHQAQL